MADTSPILIPSYSDYIGGRWLRAWNLGATFGDSAWGTANLAVYFPFKLTFTYSANRLYWGNGATLSGNVSAGIYTLGGTSLVATAAVAQAGASNLQYVSTGGAISLTAGTDYFFALACSSTTASFQANAITASQGREMGMYQQALGGLPVPGTATFATYAQVFYPICGFTRTTSGY